MIKVITDEQIKDCSMCPLKPTYTRDCGKITSKRGTSGSTATEKKPDSRCKIKVIPGEL